MNEISERISIRSGFEVVYYTKFNEKMQLVMLCKLWSPNKDLLRRTCQKETWTNWKAWARWLASALYTTSASSNNYTFSTSMLKKKAIVLRVFALPTVSKRATIAQEKNIDEKETWTNWKCLSKGFCIHCKTQLPTKVCWEKQVTGRHSGGLRSSYATPKCWQCRSYCCCHKGSLRTISTTFNIDQQQHEYSTSCHREAPLWLEA